MEKRKPSYDLAIIKREFRSVGRLRMTGSARDAAFSLGYLLQDVVDVIQSMTRKQFYKSMTSLSNVRLWQDVYHVPHRQLILYVKFTLGADGHIIVSFKEK